MSMNISIPSERGFYGNNGINSCLAIPSSSELISDFNLESNLDKADRQVVVYSLSIGGFDI